MNKIRQENDMTYRIGTIYTENKIELSPPIGLGVVYEENKIEKQHDRSYRYGLHWKMKLSYRDQSNWLLSVMKARQDNDVTNCIGVIYTEKDIELLSLIRQGTIYDEMKIGEWHDQLYMWDLC